MREKSRKEVMKFWCVVDKILERFKVTETADTMASQIGTSAAASESPPSPTSQSKSGSVDVPKVDLFVGNLSLYTEATSLKEYFE